MSRAVIADELGPLENYRLREHDPGAPGPGQVRVAIRAAGVSFVDLLNARGEYQIKAPVPFVPGSEFSGVIEALGEDVTDLKVGQAVAATSWGGAFAEVAVVDARNVDPLPADVGFPEGAVYKISALTAWHALRDRAALRPGETLLVLGAGGATGYAAVQVGCHLGARVIACASTEARRALAVAGGAEFAIDAREGDWRAQLDAATGTASVDAVFDPVGGESTERAFRCLGWNGRHLVVGFPAGIAALPCNLPLLRSASLVGVNLQQLAQADPALAASNTAEVNTLAARGLLRPKVAATFTLERFAEAMDAVEHGDLAGRVVLVMAP